VSNTDKYLSESSVKAVTTGTSLVQKMVSGVPLWQPRKGHEFKSYKRLQAEAIEKRERENAVLRKNKGAWPGERAPSYSLFLWASGPELTPILNKQDRGGKYIPYETRYVFCSSYENMPSISLVAEETRGFRPRSTLVLLSFRIEL
jgi:hypothetical protein